MSGIKLDPRDVRRVRGGVRLSDGEFALLHRALAGTARARYYREAVMRAAARDLGDSMTEPDTARRSAPRRPNYQAREAVREGAAKRDERPVRGGVPLSDREVRRVDRARRDTPESRYFREAVLAAVAADLGMSVDEVTTS